MSKQNVFRRLYMQGRGVIGLCKLLVAFALFGTQGCQRGLYKRKAIDAVALEKRPLPGNLVRETEKGEYVITPDILWMGRLGVEDMAFAGLREGENLAWCFVARCDPSEDVLVLVRLENGKSPLDVANNPDTMSQYQTKGREALAARNDSSGVVRISIRRAIEERLLGPPLPEPRHIYAVAANFASHLEHDLGRIDVEEDRAILEEGRARVFLKFPPTDPPFSRTSKASERAVVWGPFDEMRYPAKVLLPGDAERRPSAEAELVLDYEVEVGVVFGRGLTRENLDDVSDAEIRAAVAGYVLINDGKTRNPQVMNKLLMKDMMPGEENTYRTGESRLDEVMTIWDEKTCQWWSYAASCGMFTTIGPFFVARRGAQFEERVVVSGRSYAEAGVRNYGAPAGYEKDALYVRQCSLAGVAEGLQDKMIHDVPAVVRSILGANNALSFMDDGPSIEVGDIVCMGTPGGTVITSMPYHVFDAAEGLLFWKEPRFWHDSFFRGKRGQYLNAGDRLFLWGEGLGFQLVQIRAMEESEK